MSPTKLDKFAEAVALAVSDDSDVFMEWESSYDGSSSQYVDHGALEKLIKDMIQIYSNLLD